ncbi:MAG: molecular chaperone DnaJ [Candidatus Omnitrophica bacterium]|nr:molecular chaperone DnaJ [Candidatus Omnitrophota bacterium]
MSTAKDYYEVIGLSKGATVDEVKKAYRQLVMKHHPDRVPENQKKVAEEKFKEISEAYAVLSDPQKKQLYDQYGHAGIDSRYSTEDIFRGADFSSIFGNAGGGLGGIFESLFSNSGVFGGSGFSGSGRTRSGEDLQIQVTISLDEAYRGVEKDISFGRNDNCSHCSGSGAEPGSRKQTCSTCRGRGQVSAGLGGFINFAQTCPNCQGQGEIIKNRCKKCSGAGRIKVKKNLKVTIPKGVDSGSVLRLRAEGSWASGARGDLYIYINVRTHPQFKRQGDTILCAVKLNVIQAILGAEIEVPTLSGKVMMKIPPGTQPNTVFRLKGKGIIDLHSKRPGDELIEVEIEIPKKLSSREKKLIEQWAKLIG